MARRTRHARRQTIQSNTYRFFVDPEVFHGREAVIEDAELAHQIGSVLRLRAGDRVLLLDNRGWQYVVTLDGVERGRVNGQIERKELAGGEPRTKITLYAGLMRPDRFEWVLQKGTELGVSAFVPLICERSTIGDADALSEHRMERWGRIVREAAEQARRGKLPRLASALFLAAACDQAARRGAAILLWEGAGVPSLRNVLHALHQPASTPAAKEKRDERAADPSGAAHPFSVALFSGPEGGFTQAEFEAAAQYGLLAATLGPRTLRAETAPIAAVSAILYEMGDLE